MPKRILQELLRLEQLFGLLQRHELRHRDQQLLLWQRRRQLPKVQHELHLLGLGWQMPLLLHAELRGQVQRSEQWLWRQLPDQPLCRLLQRHDLQHGKLLQSLRQIRQDLRQLQHQGLLLVQRELPGRRLRFALQQRLLHDL